MYVVNCTTPANFFHAIRRQLKAEFRKPMIAFTPKSLLRHPKCVSTYNDFTNGDFQEIIDDTSAQPKKINTIVLCCGKVYYDLREAMDLEKLDTAALVRLEQLYPFPHHKFAELQKKYNQANRLIWVQEEPDNMGGWNYILRTLRENNPICVSRPESASPATGSHKMHQKQQAELIETTINLCKTGSKSK
jgi:2-oxoglutarate dehydrogenase E1 component